jgi:hypothetical protein
MLTKIYIDLDGVLVDLNVGLKKNYNFEFPKEKTPENKIAVESLWREIALNNPSFWKTLPATSYYMDLFDAILEVDQTPLILSATPELYTGVDHTICQNNKIAWVREHLGEIMAYRTIITKSKLKQEQLPLPPYADRKILIDDHPGNIERWQAAGGIGIFHTSFSNTFNELKKYQ